MGTIQIIDLKHHAEIIPDLEVLTRSQGYRTAILCAAFDGMNEQTLVRIKATLIKTNLNTTLMNMYSDTIDELQKAEVFYSCD